MLYKQRLYITVLAGLCYSAAWKSFAYFMPVWMHMHTHASVYIAPFQRCYFTSLKCPYFGYKNRELPAPSGNSPY